MNEQKLTNAGLAASVLAAFAASICCIGPIAAAFLGLTSFAALVRYEPLRPLFSAVTLASLSGSFYLAYRKPSCEEGSTCATGNVQRLTRLLLWVVTAIVCVVLTFPIWSNWILG